MIKTCLCILQKVRGDETQSDDEGVFLCEVENLGYEATGRPKTGSEVHAAGEEFKAQAGWA